MPPESAPSAAPSQSQTALDEALDGLLPLARQEQLSSLLSSTDLETLRHLVTNGMGPNTLRALASDLAYLERWCLAATGASCPGRPAATCSSVRAHHLWDPIRKESDPAHGMPPGCDGRPAAGGSAGGHGPHAPATVRRRLALWRTMHRWRGLEGAFADGQVRTALRLFVRAAGRPQARKSERALTGDLIEAMLRTCWMNRTADLRDRALLLLAFGSGGRRRSEVSGLRVEDIRFEPDIAAGKTPLRSRRLPCGSAAPRPPTPPTAPRPGSSASR